jgi:tRNA 2-selenouridine synthase
VSPFAARKVGAALISANIARYLQGPLSDQPRTWRPLLYCWRGGKRSESFTHVLREIGWDARALEGGYRAFRRAVVADLPDLARRLELRVVCGLTGSGKSRLLHTLDRLGAQVLDLEHLAAHRGSVLGNLPGAPQPSRKMFESLLWARLRALDVRRPVFVESESRRIGIVQVPQALLERMWSSDCVRVSASVGTRVTLLKDEYTHFLGDPELLGQQLDHIAALHGHAAIARWKAMAAAGDWDALVEELLSRHYDPAYERSIGAHYPKLPRARNIEIASASEASFEEAARRLMEEALEPVA